VYGTAEADNLTNGIDFATDPLFAGITGDQTGDTMAPMNAWGVTLERVSKLTRNGAKRIPGVDEATTTDGTAVPTQQALLDTMATVLGFSYAATINGNDFSLFPVIVGVDLQGKRDLSRVQQVSGGVANYDVTTQNSRKFGRGS
jgi:hypothetical protein